MDEVGGGRLGSGLGWQLPAVRVWAAGTAVPLTAFPISHAWQRYLGIMDAESANYSPFYAPHLQNPQEGLMWLDLLHLNCTSQLWGCHLLRVQLGPPPWLEQRSQPHPASNAARRNAATRKERWRELLGSGSGQPQGLTCLSAGRGQGVYVFYGSEVGA